MIRPHAAPTNPAHKAIEMKQESVSELFDPACWTPVEGFAGTDVTYHMMPDRTNRGRAIARIAFNRPDLRNAFRPQTVDELFAALEHARRQTNVGCVLLTGNGPSARDGGWAFSSGGDQAVRGPDGYKYDDPEMTGRLHILEVQRLIRFMPKVVIAVVPGWAVGGGHSLHVVCDLSIASSEHARFRQTDPDVASFDAGFGSALLARQVGQKRAREVFFLGKSYSADEALAMGMINEVVAHASLEKRAIEMAEIVNSKSPTAMRMLKYAFNLPDDGMVGQQLFAGEATRLGYATAEAREGRESFVEKRPRDFSDFPWHF